MGTEMNKPDDIQCVQHDIQWTKERPTDDRPRRVRGRGREYSPLEIQDWRVFSWTSHIWDGDEFEVLPPLFDANEILPEQFQKGGPVNQHGSGSAARLVGEAPSEVAREHHAKRKAQPITRGALDYFPDALLAVAELSRIGNEQHNPGEPLHWAKEKSTDHADCLVRHLLERGQIDPTSGLSHTVSVAWRALALLQTEIDAQRGSK